MARFVLLLVCLSWVVAFEIFASPNHAPCVQDDANRSVCMPPGKPRVIALSPHATELVAWLAGPEVLVGVDDSSDYPTSVNTLPKVADAQHVNLEQVLSLQPTLIVAWGSSLPANVLTWLEANRIPTFVSEPAGIEGIASNMERLGYLLGMAKGPLALRVDAWLSGFDNLPVAKAPVNVFYQVWEKPLITLGGPHTLSQVMKKCGGRNIFDDTQVLGPRVEVESVLARNPMLIVTSGRADMAMQSLLHWNNWPTIAAVKTGQLHVLPEDILVRPGPRLLAGAKALCDVISRVGGKP